MYNTTLEIYTFITEQLKPRLNLPLSIRLVDRALADETFMSYIITLDHIPSFDELEAHLSRVPNGNVLNPMYYHERDFIVSQLLTFLK